MKNILFRLTLLALAALTITLYSCQQEDILEDIHAEVMLEDTDNADVNLRAPLILASFDRGLCCHVKRRKAHIVLDNLTYNYYCTSGGVLTYKFYNNNNPTANPIVRVSSSATPSFCLPPRDYSVLVSNNGVPTLQYNGSNFYIPTSPGGSTSPIYSVNLSGICTLFPVKPGGF